MKEQELKEEKKSIDRLSYLQSIIGQEFVKSPSPYGRWLRGKILDAQSGKLTMGYEVREEMLNPVGILHGGVISGMMDECMGLTTFGLNLPDFYSSVNISIDFLSSARLGENLVLETNVVRQGRNIIHITCTLKNALGKLLAKGSTNMLKVDIDISKLGEK